MIDMDRINSFIENNESYLKRLENKWYVRLFVTGRPQYISMKDKLATTDNSEDYNTALSRAIDYIESSFVYSRMVWAKHYIQSLILRACQGRNRKHISNASRDRKDYLTVATIIKNEAQYIKEFVEFYKAIGVDRLLIYDNDSNDGILDVIRPYIDEGFVIYQMWGGYKVQTAAYRDAVRKCRKNSRWLAFLDADEFLFSVNGDLIQSLKQYEQYPGVCVNWVMFGPSGHDRKPDGMVIDNYCETLLDFDDPFNCRVKSIVDPSKVLTITNPHYAIYKGGLFAVSEDKKEVDNYAAFRGGGMGRAFTSTNHRQVFRINHYVTKSLEDLEIKCKRGYPDGNKNAVMEKQLEIFKGELVEDHSIVKIADAIRNRVIN